jgi:hypothetical protein
VISLKLYYEFQYGWRFLLSFWNRTWQVPQGRAFARPLTKQFLFTSVFSQQQVELLYDSDELDFERLWIDRLPAHSSFHHYYLVVKASGLIGSLYYFVTESSHFSQQYLQQTNSQI